MAVLTESIRELGRPVYGEEALARLQLMSEAETRILGTETQLRRLEDSWWASRRRVEQARLAANEARAEHSALMRIQDWRYTDKGNGAYEISGSYVYSEAAVRTDTGFELVKSENPTRSYNRIPVARPISFNYSPQEGFSARVRERYSRGGEALLYFEDYSREIAACEKVHKRAEKLRQQRSPAVRNPMVRR